MQREMDGKRPMLVAHSARSEALVEPKPAAAPPQSATGALQRQPAAGDGAPLDAATLARLTGGALEQHAGGTSTVSFLARAADPAPPPRPPPSAATAPPTATAPTESQAPADAIAITGEHWPLRMDELYDRILKRLRRDLLGERERRGRAIGEGRW